MSVRMLVNGESKDSVSALDRGLSYGDGLFETIRFVGDVAPLWKRHMQRLDDGCRRLSLPVPDTSVLQQEARTVVQGMLHAVVRITLTRGTGPRGYAPPSMPQVTRVVAAFDPPTFDQAVHDDGVRMRVCEVHLSEQPLLAGIKHLNRLEQVLARAEWNALDIGEGLLRDMHDRVISATMANLFVVIDGVLTTPSLERCGVAGVARAEILATLPHVHVCDMTLDALHGAREVFLSSSVRGILPVRSLNEVAYAPGPTTRTLQRHWRNLGFSMEQAG
ncbi:aminodeoxychorismate lyase [Rhodanobacter sp. L36]|uniref:aminodeoxychorismate lyase n=1 Tax=Rhodanobacter sp. L36 TaxID=1747221 RepID=UPI00131E3EA2|nr:aminodeoxychorismate lyase [Rhodanobacter sp. L36]